MSNTPFQSQKMVVRTFPADRRVLAFTGQRSPLFLIREYNDVPMTHHMLLYDAKNRFPLVRIGSGALGKFPVGPVSDYGSKVVEPTLHRLC